MSDDAREHDDTHGLDDFEERFRVMADRAHEMAPRASRPSSKIWHQFLEASGDRDTQDTGASLRRRIRRAQDSSAMSSRSRNVLPGAHLRSWAATVTLAVGIVVLGAGFWFSPLGPGSVFDDEAPVRHAAEVVSPVASPQSTPDLSNYLPLDIPGVTCDVEPLTEDEVMDIVRNPHVRNSEIQAPRPGLEPTLGHLAEAESAWMDYYTIHDWASSGRPPTPEEYEAIRGDADQFWSCLRVGTSYQVWSLMGPSEVQLEILRNFPVFREEEEVRQYITRFGPLRYSAAISHLFPDLDGGEGPHAERSVHPDAATGTVVEDVYGDLLYAYVAFPSDSGDVSSTVNLVFRDFGDGVWRAVGMYITE